MKYEYFHYKHEKKRLSAIQSSRACENGSVGWFYFTRSIQLSQIYEIDGIFVYLIQKIFVKLYLLLTQELRRFSMNMSSKEYFTLYGVELSFHVQGSPEPFVWKRFVPCFFYIKTDKRLISECLLITFYWFCSCRLLSYTIYEALLIICLLYNLGNKLATIFQISTENINQI